MRWTVFASLAALAAAVIPPTPVVPESLSAALRQRIAIWARVDGHFGVSASVILAGGAQWSGAAGLAASGEAMRVDHLVQIASITKTMTAAVVLQLVDDGILRLDDPVGRWLPAIPNVDPAISIRQLLNHSSGVADYTDEAALGHAIAGDPGHVFTPPELLRFVGVPRFPPGAATEYTNTAFLVLGQIVERTTGRDIVEVYRQRLWEPLDLTDVFMPGFGDPPAPVAAALRAGSVVNPLDEPARITVGHSAFGLLSNAATVAKWGRALFSCHLVSPAMQREMRTLTPAPGSIPGETGVGLGIRSYGYFERTQLGHSGGAAFGSSLLLFDPASGVTVAVLMNQAANANHFTLAPALLEIAASASRSLHAAD
jgi:D-alanyl-D-alanine carboxypeptidase